MKKSLFILVLMLSFASMAQAKKSYAIPSDLPTYEALINLHKILASGEEQSMKQVAASKIVQDSVTGFAGKFYNVRNVLNSYLETGFQWTTFAAAISQLGLSSGKLVTEYGRFTKYFTQHMPKKPFITLEYANLNYKLYKEVQDIKKDIVTLAAMQTGVFKASLKENFELIMYVQGKINMMRFLISSAYGMLWWESNTNYHFDYIWEILNDELLNEIAQKVIVKFQMNNRELGFTSL